MTEKTVALLTGSVSETVKSTEYYWLEVSPSR
jgi:hypothetical protein